MLLEATNVENKEGDMGLVFVGGVNGVGKTSIAQEVAKISDVRALKGSEELMKRLGCSSPMTPNPGS